MVDRSLIHPKSNTSDLSAGVRRQHATFIQWALNELSLYELSFCYRIPKGYPFLGVAVQCFLHLRSLVHKVCPRGRICTWAALCRKKFCQKNNCRDFLYAEGRLESMCAESRAFQLASWPIICRSKSSFCSGSMLRSLCHHSRHPKSEVPTLNEQRYHIFKIHGRLVDCVHSCLPPCKKNAINILMQNCFGWHSPCDNGWILE